MIDPDLLNTVLAGAGHPWVCRQLQASSLDEVRGQVYRLELVWAPGRGEVPPPTLILKVPGSVILAEPELNAPDTNPREVFFYRHLAAALSMTPVCFATAAPPQVDRWLIVLEDLAGLRQGDMTVGLSLGDAEHTVTGLASLHAAYWGQGQSVVLQALSEIVAARRTATPEAIARYYLRAWPSLRADPLLPDALRDFGDRLGSAIARPFAHWATRPATLVHGDAHVENWRFDDKTGHGILLDWEDVRLGCGPADLAWLLGTSLPLEAGAAERDLLRLYYQQLCTLGVVGYEWAACLGDYRWGLVDAFIQVTISGQGEPLAEGGMLARVMAASTRHGLADWF